MSKRIEELERGCGKVICADTDYDGEIVICGKYGSFLCNDCKEIKQKITGEEK